MLCSLLFSLLKTTVRQVHTKCLLMRTVVCQLQIILFLSVFGIGKYSNWSARHLHIMVLCSALAKILLLITYLHLYNPIWYTLWPHVHYTPHVTHLELKLSCRGVPGCLWIPFLHPIAVYLSGSGSTLAADSAVAGSYWFCIQNNLVSIYRYSTVLLYSMCACTHPLHTIGNWHY